MPVTTHAEPGTTSHIIKFKGYTKSILQGKRLQPTHARENAKNVTLTGKIQRNSCFSIYACTFH